MRFTESQDGIKRVTVRIDLRLSAEEVAVAKKYAEADGESWREWLASKAALGVEDAMQDGDGRYEQCYGRGGD